MPDWAACTNGRAVGNRVTLTPKGAVERGVVGRKPQNAAPSKASEWYLPFLWQTGQWDMWLETRMNGKEKVLMPWLRAAAKG